MNNTETRFLERQQEILANWFRLKHLPPPGYVLSRGRSCFLLDPERAPLLRRAWELVLAGTSVDAVLEILNGEMGFRTTIRGRTGGKPLARCTLYKILRDPFYCGRLTIGNETVAGEHEPLVSIEEFDRVQVMLGARARGSVGRFARDGLATDHMKKRPRAPWTRRGSSCLLEPSTTSSASGRRPLARTRRPYEQPGIALGRRSQTAEGD